MGRTITFTKQQQKQFDHWLNENYDWAKAKLIDPATQLDIEDGILTERQAIVGNLVGAMLSFPDLQQKVFSGENVF